MGVKFNRSNVTYRKVETRRQRRVAALCKDTVTEGPAVLSPGGSHRCDNGFHKNNIYFTFLSQE